MATARQAGDHQLLSSSECVEGAHPLKLSTEVSGPGKSAEQHYYQGMITSGGAN